MKAIICVFALVAFVWLVSLVVRLTKAVRDLNYLEGDEVDSDNR